MRNTSFSTTPLTKEQILNYMIDVLGYNYDQDMLESQTKSELWDMLTKTERKECEEYSLWFWPLLIHFFPIYKRSILGYNKLSIKINKGAK